MKEVVYITMILLAIASIQSESLRTALIYLSIFSLSCSLSYVLLGAPDVAIAEAVIGVSLSTVLFLVAIKKYRVFRVYYHVNVEDPNDIPEVHRKRDNIEDAMQEYFKNKELEIEIINTKDDFNKIHGNNDYDVIIEHTKESARMYGSHSNYLYGNLTQYLIENNIGGIDYEYLTEDEAQ